MKRYLFVFNILSISLLGLVMGGCGTTSDLKSASNTDELIQLTTYKKVIVLDFQNATTKKLKSSEKAQVYAEKVALGGKIFADKIALEIKGKRAFDEIIRETDVSKLQINPENNDTLIIRGKVTRYEEGDAMAKLFIGMGAGSTYFDATVELVDPVSQKVIGEIITDKNSWGLGGALAASQTIESFMTEAAVKTAEQVAVAKRVRTPEPAGL